MPAAPGSPSKKERAAGAFLGLLAASLIIEVEMTRGVGILFVFAMALTLFALVAPSKRLVIGGTGLFMLFVCLILEIVLDLYHRRLRIRNPLPTGAVDVGLVMIPSGGLCFSDSWREPCLQRIAVPPGAYAVTVTFGTQAGTQLISQLSLVSREPLVKNFRRSRFSVDVAGSLLIVADSEFVVAEMNVDVERRRALEMLDNLALSQGWLFLTAKHENKGVVLLPGWGNGTYSGNTSVNELGQAVIRLSFLTARS